tara:strand:- start:1939 stop:2199 length:261 start_codon:yes stop_codon:yes gene_type:complete
LFSEEETKCLESQIERFEGENEKLKTHMYHLIVNGINGLSPDWVGGKIPLNKKNLELLHFGEGTSKVLCNYIGMDTLQRCLHTVGL